MNLRAIADAIAAHFVGLTATYAGQTLNLAATPSALLPNDPVKGPVLVVFPPTGVLEVGVSAMNSDTYDFPVRVLFDPLSVPDRTGWLYAWSDALRLSAGAEMALGLAYVGHAEAASLRAELDGETYAGAQYDVAEVVIHVQMHEPGYP